jgi:hypothetical protein
MRTAIAALLLAAAFCGIAAPAQAKLEVGNVVGSASVISFEASTVMSEPAAAILESNYFNTKQPPIAGIRGVPCGIQAILFQKARLIRACD